MDVVVAIEVPPPQERLLGAFVLRSTLHYAGMPEKFQRLPDPFSTGSSLLCSSTRAAKIFDLRPRASRTRAQYILSNPQIKKPVTKSENPEKFRNRFAAKPFCFLVLASAQKLPLRRHSNV
jgi:hypothetical protein